jgi:hypothetical protein
VVDALRKSIAEDTLTGVLDKPSALWLTGKTPGDYYGEDGTLNTDQLLTDARQAITDSGLARASRFKGSADGGARGTAPSRREPTWNDLIRDGRKR